MDIVSRFNINIVLTQTLLICHFILDASYMVLISNSTIYGTVYEYADVGDMLYSAYTRLSE